MQVKLLLDEKSVASARGGVRFALSSATPQPDNPLLEPGEPHQWDSLQVSWPSTVLYNERERKFRCWYSGFDAVQAPGRFWQPGYAESDDGIHWVKPNLGQVEYLGRPTNRICIDWPNIIQSFVFENPDPKAPPSRRFGSYWTEVAPSAGGPDRGDTPLVKGLGFSPDGKVWTRHATVYEPKTRAEFQDLNQLLFEPDDPNPAMRVKLYGQRFRKREYDNGPLVRQIGLAHGETIEHVKDFERTILEPEKGIDEELHFAVVTKLHGKYLMLFESDRFAKNPLDGDLRLAISDDGLGFRRVHRDQAILDTGPKGSWSQNLLVTTCGGILTIGDEHWIYYHGCPGIYNSWPAGYAVTPERRGSMFYPAYLGLATLPRDRFAYAQGPGEVEIDATIGADGLWLNTDGDVTVRAGDATGRVGDEKRQTVYRKVIWDRMPSSMGRVRVSLSSSTARLYSILS